MVDTMEEKMSRNAKAVVRQVAVDVSCRPHPTFYDNLLVNMEETPVKTILHEGPNGKSGKPICDQFEC